MHRARQLALSLAAGTLALAAGATPGIAQDQGSVIRLDYQAARDCPDENAFWARIRGRAPEVRAALPGESARAFSVTLTSDHHASGRVQFLGAEGTERSRDIHAGTCSEVADALALVIALVIDPEGALSPSASPPAPAASDSVDASPQSADASRQTTPEPPDASVVPATAASIQEAPAPNPAAASKAPPRPPSHAAVVVRPRPAARPTPARAEKDRHTGAFSIGAQLSISTGVSPNLLVGGAPYIGWRAHTMTWIAPSLRVSFFRGGSGSVAAADGSATFTWTVGRVDICPFASSGLASRGPLQLVACARTEAGAIESSGAGIALPADTLHPWLAFGPLARVEWPILDGLFLDLEAGALFRVTNDRFFFYPNTTIYQVPLVGVSAGAGVGAHFL